MTDGLEGLRELAYTAVGLGLLGLRQAHARLRVLHAEVAKVAVEVDERVEAALADVEPRLPEDLRPVVATVRSTLRSVENALRAVAEQ